MGGGVPSRTQERRRVASALLRQTAMSVYRYTGRVARRLDLSVTDVQAVGVLVAAQDPLTASDLGRHIGLSRPAVTAMLHRLQDSGHVRRSRSDEDGRRSMISATEHALDDSRDHFVDLNDAVDQALAASTPEEVEAFLAVMHRVADAMNDL